MNAAEIAEVLAKAELKPGQVLRKKARANAELGLTGTESDAELIEHMAAHPTLLQRPLGVAGSQAVLGRPVENLLDLIESS